MVLMMIPVTLSVLWIQSLWSLLQSATPAEDVAAAEVRRRLYGVKRVIVTVMSER